MSWPNDKYMYQCNILCEKLENQMCYIHSLLSLSLSGCAGFWSDIQSSEPWYFNSSTFTRDTNRKRLPSMSDKIN